MHIVIDGRNLCTDPDFVVLGFTGGLLVLAFYKDADLFYNHFEGTQFRINAAWGWTMLGTNTLLTGLIIGKIVYPYLIIQPASS